jgi:hypothetical protein
MIDRPTDVPDQLKDYESMPQKPKPRPPKPPAPPPAEPLPPAAIQRIIGPNFVAGLVIKDDRAVRAAPILGYMIGWPTERIVALAQRRGWTIEHEPDSRP